MFQMQLPTSLNCPQVLLLGNGSMFSTGRMTAAQQAGTPRLISNAALSHQKAAADITSRPAASYGLPWQVETTHCPFLLGLHVGPCLYISIELPKVYAHVEARSWNDRFESVQKQTCSHRGTSCKLHLKTGSCRCRAGRRFCAGGPRIQEARPESGWQHRQAAISGCVGQPQGPGAVLAN